MRTNIDKGGLASLEQHMLVSSSSVFQAYFIFVQSTLISSLQLIRDEFLLGWWNLESPPSLGPDYVVPLEQGSEEEMSIDVFQQRIICVAPYEPSIIGDQGMIGDGHDGFSKLVEGPCKFPLLQ